MSEGRGSLERYRRWFLGGLIGGGGGALVFNLAPQILPTERGFWTPECLDLLDEERSGGWTQYSQSGMNGDLATPVWMEFSLAVRVRS